MLFHSYLGVISVGSIQTFKVLPEQGERAGGAASHQQFEGKFNFSHLWYLREIILSKTSSEMRSHSLLVDNV